MSIQQIKVFGERHTATNATHAFIEQNFSQKLVGYWFLGWKHRLAPQRREWQKKDLDDTLIVVTARDPYTWLPAMHRNAYNQHLPELQTLPFELFLQYPIEDYEHVVAMWNQKYRAYLDLLEQVPHGVLLRAEDLAMNHLGVFQQLEAALGAESAKLPTPAPVKRYLNSSGEYDDGDVLKSLTERADLGDREQAMLDQLLDQTLVKQLGY